MNRVNLIGRLTAEPEMRATQSGIAQCSFRLAVQRRHKNAQGEREADFIPVVCWRQTAELAAKYLHKGNRCAVEGSIQTRAYTAQDGQKRTFTEVIADAVEFLQERAETDTGANAGAQDDSRMNCPHQVGFQELSPEDLEQLPF